MTMLVLVLSSLVLGELTAELPSCYKVDRSWNDPTPLDIVSPVLDYQQCQTFCKENADCQGWTWASENNSEFPGYCFMFSTLGQPTDFQDSISGPPSCLCSSVEACDINGDNELEFVPDIIEEINCQDLCVNNSLCQYYTWYDATEAPFDNVCILLSSCPTKNSMCTGCHSAPVPCSQELPSTTAPPPFTTPPPSTTLPPATTTAPPATTTTAALPYELLYSADGWEYYKVPVKSGERLVEGKVPETCRAAGQGLEAVCAGPEDCRHTDTNSCSLTPLSTECYRPMRPLSQILCNTDNLPDCDVMNGLFNYYGLDYYYGECGAIKDHHWCAHGKNYVSGEDGSLYAFCARQV